MEGLNYVPEDMIFSFSDVTQVLAEKVKSAFHDPQPAESGRFIIPFFSGSGGCNDAFTGFGFLAFLLALLDLILELQDGNRRRRSVPNDLGLGPEAFTTMALESGPEAQGAAAACYSLHRAFLNALATRDGECARRFMCEGAEEAAASGPLGRMIATVASANAASWLTKENATLYKGVEEAGAVGAAGGACGMKYSQCFGLPPLYRFPRVFTGDPLRDYRSPGGPSSYGSKDS
ncbi:uncharacterized protein LOC122256196 [Penaeus japonicus]|uniref:uncharacterized protein LOC122256196 n=1 Tax=Penaeus japonicus TaxID=27405 RepID=UPI001C70E5ED|nr:uncharacterized protein LOC122256196 [Penaeus japonicus]